MNVLVIACAPFSRHYNVSIQGSHLQEPLHFCRSPPPTLLLLLLISLVLSSKVHLKFRCSQPRAREPRPRVWSACGCTECDNSAVTFIMMFYCLLQEKVPLRPPPPIPHPAFSRNSQRSGSAFKWQGSSAARLQPWAHFFFFLNLLGKRWRLTDMTLNLYIFRFQHLGGICQMWSRFPLRLALSHVRNFLKVPQVICPFLKDRPL